MGNKLELMLKKINLSKEDYFYFENAKLDKIVGNKKKDSYIFYITIPYLMPIEIYEKVNELTKNEYNTFKEVKVVFCTDNLNIELIKEYFNYYIKKYAKEYPMLEIFIDSKIKLEDNKLIIEVANKAEEMKLKTIIKKLEAQLHDIGCTNINLCININKDLNEKITKELDEIKVEIIKQEKSPIIKGNYINEKPMSIQDIIYEEDNIVIEGEIFKSESKEFPKTNLITFKITDKTDSIDCKVFERDITKYKELKSSLKEENYVLLKGNVKNDPFSKELSFYPNDIVVIKKEKEEIKDKSEKKRVELHTHTMMSQMDGISQPSKLVKQAYKLGHAGIAITDHNSVQSFPEVYHTVCGINKKIENEKDRFKVLYGVELNLIDDGIDIVIRPSEENLLKSTYVVFDVETTGLNAGGGDSMIEIGAVKICNGEIIDRFDELINPGVKLSKKIIEITSITDNMLEGKSSEEEVVKRFIEWTKDLPMVAHNAKFDISFIEMAYKKYNLGKFQNTVIDTLELARAMDNQNKNTLTDLVKRYNVEWDEDKHHRADYDSEGTALVFHKMMKKLDSQNISSIFELNKLVNVEDSYKQGKLYHINLIAKNREGLKNMFKLISLANTKYLYKTPRILRSEIVKHKEGLLIGSGCYQSEIFLEARTKSEEELSNLIKFYDYVEVQPMDVYNHLVETNEFSSNIELLEHIKKIITTTKNAGKIIVATGDVHHILDDDKIYREIIINQKVPGGGLHPFARKNIKNIPSQYFRTTDQMLEDFSFLDEELRNEIVITNTNKISNMVEEIEVIIDTKGIPFSPKIENSSKIVKDLVYNKAHEVYGDNLPLIIEDRIKQELSGIIKGGFDVIYLIAQKLVKRSNDDGYLVGSRGSVGSSFVATMMGITEVNPLPSHYICPDCKHSIFEENGELLGKIYACGYDLPDKKCPNCNTLMNKEGFDMPFATFLGFDCDKVPDIDLNFSGEYQWKAHEYTKELFGEDNVYRAGTIGTVADKTAYGYVLGYFEDRGITKRRAEIERLALGCTGIKRTTGQHPGGIVVVPDYKEIFDFTPYQYPADDPKSKWRTTHFDYHAIDQNLLKLDILGHDDPTMLKMLQDLSKIDVTKISMSDSDVMKIFSSPEVLGVTKEQIMCETGTLGVPEFGTKFVIGMLVDTRPKTFEELLKISGLSHGTDVWLGNAQELIKNNICKFKDVIGCRDDIMVYLTYNGVEPKRAFKIMEFVRKGKPSKEPEVWETFEKELRKANIVEWYIKSCQKIKYMFPKAHAAAYVMSALRIAYFKVHHPIWYYAAYFSVRCNDFDIESMIKGYNAIKNKMMEIINKGSDVTDKEQSVFEVLHVALEASARGLKFANLDINKSDSVNFTIIDNNTLIPPFRTIDGLGITVAQNIVEEREKGPFLSIEDLQKRGKVSKTLIEKMREMKMLEGMSETSQLSLF